ncbi:trafficking protein particle complex subunit 9-like isoform X2 [Lineus longissimus]|uniref:trafficking protein particle complex subunit 9-like isoform X2 n=1 Tax=Lineus longissimus TaxID=88925 RepID=UPI002B4ED3FA
MSYPDYQQKVEDHQALLILVRQIGSKTKNKAFNRVYDRLTRVQCIRIPDQQRVIWLRYRKSYPPENNEWGDFQAHRKVFGMVCVGRCEELSDLEALQRSFEYQKKQYSSTLFDSRLFVLGMDDKGKVFRKQPSIDSRDSREGTPTNARSRKNSNKDSPEKTLRGFTVVDIAFDDVGRGIDSKTNFMISSQENGGLDLVEQETGEKTAVVGLNEATEGVIVDNGDQSMEEVETTDEGNRLVSPCHHMEINDPLQANSPTDSICDKSNEGSPSTDRGSPGLGSPRQSVRGSPRKERGSPRKEHGSPLLSPKREPGSPRKGNGMISPDSGSPDEEKTVTESGDQSENGAAERDNSKRTNNVWFYPTIESCFDLEDKMQEFVMSLFWVLEGKRLDRSFEKLEKVPLLAAPFEKKDMVGIDMEGRSYKKKCLGRYRKHLADLSLLAGLPGEALLHYQTSLDLLKSSNDWLWLAGAYEGLCSASVAIHYPKVQRQPLTRNLSFSTTRGKSAMSEAKFKSGGLLSSGPNGLDLAVDQRMKNCVPQDDIIEKYKEALSHYSKYKNAGIIAMEASIKACRVLVLQKKNLHAAEFLQNVVYLNLQLSEDEKIQRFSTLSLLYSQIGFYRKAAFFKRVAAMQCVAPSNQKPGWIQCYNLLLQTLDGYRIPMDPRKFPDDHTSGWPVVQLRVLHELVYSARRMGNPAVAIRHMTFLLHTMLDHLSEQERKDISQVLETYTSKCEAPTATLTLDNGTVLPPVQLGKLPIVKSFKPLNLPPHLRPIKIKSKADVAKENNSPFIYSPLMLKQNTRKLSGHKIGFSWVEGNVCEVALQVCNPMPYELKVINMGLLTEGVEFESYPANLSLPAESGPYPVKILCTPKGSGQLNVIGYTTNVLGIKNQCLLEDTSTVKEERFTIEVVPSLPQLQVTTSLPKSSSFSNMVDSANVVTSAVLNMFAGESQECQITLKNSGATPVEKMDLSLDSKLNADTLSKVFVWSLQNLESQLPLNPGCQACFTIYINGVSDFLPTDKSLYDDTSNYLSPSTRPRMTRVTSEQKTSDNSTTDEYTTKTIEALLRLQYSGSAGLAEGYCRQCSVAFTLEVQPSLVFSKWDVGPTDSPSHCFLVLDVLNTTTHEVDLMYSSENRVILEAKESKRIAVRVGRCSGLPAAEVHKVGTSYAKYQHELLALQYSLHLSDFVDIRWTMASTKAVGKMTVDKLLWTPAQLDTIRMSPVQWDLVVNGGSHEPDEEVVGHEGETMEILMTITNNSDVSIENAVISLGCFRDQMNGIHDYGTDNHVICLGCDSVHLEKIAVNESYSHRCLLLFCLPGLYKLDIKCTSQPIGGAASGQKHEWRCYTVNINVKDE